MKTVVKNKIYHHFNESSTIYETFKSFHIILNFCGFFHNGMNTKPDNVLLEMMKFALSVVYSFVFIILLTLNVLLGEQEPEKTKSFLLRHGSHKLYCIELIFLLLILWNNFYYRREIRMCLQVIDKFDVFYEVRDILLRLAVNIYIHFSFAFIRNVIS